VSTYSDDRGGGKIGGEVFGLNIISKAAAELLARILRILEVSGSNLGPETANLTDISQFSSVLPCNSYLKQATATSFHILSNSLVTNHPIIRYYIYQWSSTRGPPMCFVCPACICCNSYCDILCDEKLLPDIRKHTFCEFRQHSAVTVAVGN
jgi:hypothetical protein